MLRVFVWSYRGKNEAWGHAAMQVDQTYISWWPQKPGQVPSGIHKNIYASHPFRNRSYMDDVRDESQSPDHVIALEGLDESGIKDWWQSFGLTRDGAIYQGPLQSWDTLTRNCSDVVATALKRGGGDKYASWQSSWNMVWTPEAILQYVRSIEQGLRSARK